MSFEGTIDPATGDVVGARWQKARADFTEDGHFEKGTIFESDGGVFPTTTAEYDVSGRLLRSTLSFDGRTMSRTVNCTYDKQGKPSEARIITESPEEDRAITYCYGPNWRSVRFKTSVASLLTTVWFDKDRRAVRAVEVDELRGIERSVRDFTYQAGLRKDCWHAPSEPSGCVTVKVDAQGREIGRISTDGSESTESFEVDAVGNWIRHVRTWSSSDFGRKPQAFWRDITYW